MSGLPAYVLNLTQTSATLSTAVADLKRKTDEMPVFDFKPTETTLAEVETGLRGIQSSLTQFRDRTQLKQDGLDAILGALMTRVNEVGKSSESAIGPITYQLAEIQRRIEAVDGNINRTDYGKLIADIQQQLTEIQSRGFFKNVFGGK